MGVLKARRRLSQPRRLGASEASASPPLGIGAPGAFVRECRKNGELREVLLDFTRAEILALKPSAGFCSMALRSTGNAWCADLSSSPPRLGFSPVSPIASMTLYSCSYEAGPAGTGGSLDFGGTLELGKLGDDLLSFDCLHFYGLRLPFSFDGPVIAEAKGASIDPRASMSRRDSIASQFALLPKSFSSSAGGELEAQGFTGLEGAYVPQSPLPKPWAALLLRIGMGKLGELADSAELAAELALGWSANPPAVFAAVKLPGEELLGRVGLQGIIGLRPGEASLSRRSDGAWTLWLRGLRLSLLGIDLPPGGHAEVQLTGDRSGEGGKPAWYCAYGADVKKGGQAPPERAGEQDERPTG